MHARSKHLVLGLAVAPVVATLGVTAAAPSDAVAHRQQTMKNGSFDAGRTGWYTSSSPTKMTIVKKGRGGTRAALLTNRRTGPAVLNSRSNVTRSTEAGQRYTVSAFVRTTQPSASGRLILRETSNGRAVKNTSKRFNAVKAWRKVTMTATTRRAGTDLNVRVLANRLKKNKSLLVDDVSVLKWLPPLPLPTDPTPTDPTPTPTDPTPTPTDPTPTPTDPTPTPTDPTPTPTDPGTPPGGSTAGHLTNGCAYNARGIPASCGTILGSAYQSNTDPTSWEGTMNKQLGIRRTYWGGSQVTSAVNTAKADLAKGRLPWISFKLPYSWSEMASGKGDAWATDLATKLSKLDGPVWLAFHHEPETDGDIKQWTAMQARMAPIVRAAASNVAYTIILTGWHQYFGDAQYKLDNMMPKNTKIDMLGLDVYNRYGAPTNGKIQTTRSNLDRDYFAPTSTWAKNHDMAWGVAESGYTDQAAEDDPTWIQQTYNEMKARGGVAFTYFNSNLNSTANWSLTTDKKKSQFAAVMQKSPTL